MKHGFCEQAVVPVRSQPGDHLEMCNQLLFGDLFLVKDSLNDWLLIETVGDNYEGWVDRKQIKLIDRNLFENLRKERPVYSMESCCNAVAETGRTLRLTQGARLPAFSDEYFQIDGQSYSFSGDTSVSDANSSVEKIIQTARTYLGSPYLWGGRSPFGIDCSGLTQIVFKMCGIQLERDAAKQALQGESILLIDEAKTADLAFFENSEGNITHVGILIDNSQIIHASGIVRIDKIDHQGIYLEDEKKYTHTLRIIKRILF